MSNLELWFQIESRVGGGQIWKIEKSGIEMLVHQCSQYRFKMPSPIYCEIRKKIGW